MTTIASYVPPAVGAIEPTAGRVSAKPGGWTLWQHRGLIGQMTRREVIGRYRGSVLGIAWSLVHPLVMLAVYTFAFGFLWKVSPRGGATSGGGIADFALFAFAGMTVYGMMSETLNRSTSCIPQHANYVKKVVFPLEIFPVVYLLTALVHGAGAVLLLIAGNALWHGSLPWTMILAPLTLVPLALFVVGGSWVLAAVGAYLRDITQITAVITVALIYVSPVFYSTDTAEARHAGLATLLRLNPITVPLENFRAAVLGAAGGGEPAPAAWTVAHVGFSVLVAFGGFVFFRRVKRGFADVV